MLAYFYEVQYILKIFIAVNSFETKQMPKDVKQSPGYFCQLRWPISSKSVHKMTKIPETGEHIFVNCEDATKVFFHHKHISARFDRFKIEFSLSCFVGTEYF